MADWVITARDIGPARRELEDEADGVRLWPSEQGFSKT
jgi:hypothetical protein